MSYTKHTWVNGETITDTLLNHLEDGVNSALTTFKINVTYNLDTEEATCDKTFAQIKEAYDNNFTLMLGEVTILGDSADPVNIPLSEYYESVDEWPANFFFDGVGSICSVVKHISLYVNDDEEDPISFEIGDVSIYNEVTVVFTKDSGYNYSLQDINVKSADGGKTISVEEYLESNFLQYKAVINGVRYMQVLTPISFLDYNIVQDQGRNILEVTHVAIDSEGNVSAEAVYSPSN